jgi:hypothetical protein
MLVLAGSGQEGDVAPAGRLVKTNDPSLSPWLLATADLELISPALGDSPVVLSAARAAEALSAV